MRHVEDTLTSAGNAVREDSVTCRTFDASEMAQSGRSDALFLSVKGNTWAHIIEAMLFYPAALECSLRQAVHERATE